MNAPTSIILNERPVIDLDHRHFEATMGNILVIGTWYMDPETGDSDPCLVLIDATRRKGRVIPCIVPLDGAWRWTVEIGDPAHVWRTISGWIAEGALPGSPSNDRDLWAVFDAVQSRLRDMMAMPPMPVEPAIKYQSAPGTVGRIVVTGGNGSALNEVEVRAANVRS